MIKRLFSATLFLLCLLQLPFCKRGISQHRDIELINPKFDSKLENMLQFSVPIISVDELHEELKDVYLIDTREKEEYDVSHIKGAHFGGYSKFKISDFSQLRKDAKIVLYCSVGYRSEKIAEKMQKAGFSNVHNLYGSIFEWVNAGYPVVQANDQEANEIHTYNTKWGQWVNQPKLKKIH